MQRIVVFSCWILGALQGSLLILIPQMMLQGQLTALQLALPLSFGAFTFMYYSGYWGKRLDKRGNNQQSIQTLLRGVLIGFLISQVSFVLLLQYSGLQGFVLVIALSASRFLHGFFGSAFIPTAQLTLSAVDKQGEKLVWSSIATNIGRVTAPLMIFIPNGFSYFSLWLIIAVTLVCVVCTYYIQDKTAGYAPPNAQPLALTDLPFKLSKNPLLLLVCVTAVLLTLFSSQLQFSLGPLLLQQLANADLASQATASLLLTASVTALFAQFFLYRFLSRSLALLVLVISTCLFIGCSLFALQVQLFVAVILMSLALSIAPPWYTALAIHNSQHHKARTAATISQGHTLGNAVGAGVGGMFFYFGEQMLRGSFMFLMGAILIAWCCIYRQASRETAT